MHLTLSNLKAIQFKNIASCSLSFSARFNCFTGNNGAGKTNLLDAIYYLSICKSNFNVSDKQLMRHQQDFFRLEGVYHHQQKKIQVDVAYANEKHKKLNFNGQKVLKMQDHLGRLPIVFIAPDDIGLVKGHSNDRRKAIDKVLCQSNATYLKQLSIYQKTIKQRNHHLKTCKRQPDFTLLDTYNHQLIPAAKTVFDIRQQFLKDLMPIFQHLYQSISLENEAASFQYISPLFEDDYAQLLKNTQWDDVYAQRTTVGIHKDDVAFLINEQPAKQYGSQGQQKNFLIAFQLACARYMYQINEVTPILLLDDIFDKLDSNRVAALLTLLQQKPFGQVFITDTEMSRMQLILNTLKVEKKFFKVVEGKVKEF